MTTGYKMPSTATMLRYPWVVASANNPLALVSNTPTAAISGSAVRVSATRGRSRRKTRLKTRAEERRPPSMAQSGS